MTVKFHPGFQKRLQKLRAKERDRFFDRLSIFIIDPHDQRINAHRLKGGLKDYYSIDVGGDIRAIYRIVNDDTVIFMNIGTHHQLYRS